MYTLYYAPISAAMAPQMVLEEIGATYELIHVDVFGAKIPEWYLELNPNGRVPTLAYHDQVLWEAAAIVMHLCDRHPEAGLAPAPGAPERGRFYQWLLYLADTYHPAVKAYYYAHRLSADPGHFPAIKAKALETQAGIWQILDRALEPGPYLLAERFSAADLYLFMMVAWLEDLNGQLDQPLTVPPNIEGFAVRLRQRPSVRAMLKTHGMA
jgi:glutathione S-transferase